MLNPFQGAPVVAFPLPPEPPAAVAAAEERYRRVVAAYADAKAGVLVAEESLEAARRARVRLEADHALEGKTPKPDETIPPAEAALTVARSRLEPLVIAVDEAGNTLADAIADARAEWLAVLAPVETDAEERLRQAVADAIQAANELGRARSAQDWLANFDRGLAHAGRAHQFNASQGAPLRARVPKGALNGTSTQALLDAALSGAARPEPPKTSKLTEEEQARFLAGRR